jgi:hypothetical protein
MLVRVAATDDEGNLIAGKSNRPLAKLTTLTKQVKVVLGEPVSTPHINRNTRIPVSPEGAKLENYPISAKASDGSEVPVVLKEYVSTFSISDLLRLTS